MKKEDDEIIIFVERTNLKYFPLSISKICFIMLIDWLID